MKLIKLNTKYTRVSIFKFSLNVDNENVMPAPTKNIALISNFMISKIPFLIFTSISFTNFQSKVFTYTISLIKGALDAILFKLSTTNWICASSVKSELDAICGVRMTFSVCQR